MAVTAAAITNTMLCSQAVVCSSPEVPVTPVTRGGPAAQPGMWELNQAPVRGTARTALGLTCSHGEHRSPVLILKTQRHKGGN